MIVSTASSRPSRVDDEVRLVIAEDHRVVETSEAAESPRNTSGHSNPKVMSANGISQRITRHMATS